MATDLSAGQAPESALGATILAVRMARAMDLSDDDLVDTYYACITRFIGCTSTAQDVAPVTLGDELSANFSFTMADPLDEASVRLHMQQYFAPGQPDDARQQIIDMILPMLPQLPELAIPHCEQAIALSSRLPISSNVPTLLAQMESRWDGKNPTRKGGEDLPLLSRIIEFAVVAELHRRAGGVTSMLEIAKHRAGGQFDPAVCSLFVKQAPTLLEGFSSQSNWELYLQTEPGEPKSVSAAQLQVVAESFADFTDNKSGWLLGHSRQVAALAFKGAEQLGYPLTDCKATFIASLLHDIGRAAIPNGIWDKPGALSLMESRQAQTHCLHTENILSYSPVFSSVVDMACSSQERCDGSGYHRRRLLDDRQCGLLAVANMYDALTHDRPWREAFSTDAAAELLIREVDTGRLPREPARAVLEAEGHQKSLADNVYPDGLTRREADVLKQLARGLSNNDIAARLSIAAKTVDNHVQNLYGKIGAKSRTAAAMYALEKGLFTRPL
jgi:HD-GYP domain-containing protein (c-di-GMP phosphodiesterase class II)